MLGCLGFFFPHPETCGPRFFSVLGIQNITRVWRVTGTRVPAGKLAGNPYPRHGSGSRRNAETEPDAIEPEDENTEDKQGIRGQAAEGFMRVSCSDFAASTVRIKLIPIPLRRAVKGDALPKKKPPLQNRRLQTEHEDLKLVRPLTVSARPYVNPAVSQSRWSRRGNQPKMSSEGAKGFCRCCGNTQRQSAAIDCAAHGKFPHNSSPGGSIGKVRTCSGKLVPLQRQFHVNSGNVPIFCGKVAAADSGNRGSQSRFKSGNSEAILTVDSGN
ncbi:hypothetical protein C8R45DRAFT_946655 [Mycena sanguinolenta]|nr:hypothetical protein C8R45DRAFT_946655 [Mycena sanguinolenta]